MHAHPPSTLIQPLPCNREPQLESCSLLGDAGHGTNVIDATQTRVDYAVPPGRGGLSPGSD